MPDNFRSVDSEFKRREEEGREVLARYELDRFPFVLFLRSFRITTVSGTPAYPGDPSGIYVLRDRISKALSHGVKTLAIAEAGELPSFQSANASPSPLLVLAHENWQSVVEYLIPSASIIVMELETTSPGVVRELEMIGHHRRESRTVVVLPDNPQVFSLSESSEPLLSLPRVIGVSELLSQSPLDSFVFADLLEQTYKLADLEQHERVAIDLNHEREKRFPTTFRGVGVGYERLGRSCLCRGALAEAKVRFQKAQIAFVVEGDSKGAAAQFLNFARVGCAAGDGAHAREYLERVRSSVAVDGYDFDVEAGLRELADDGFL